MADFAQFGALCVALVSFCLSLTALMIHYAKRAENPLTAPLQAQIDSLRLGQTDIIDRVDQWTKRDRTRRLRAQPETDDSAPPAAMTPDQVKQELRMRARQMGIVR